MKLNIDFLVNKSMWFMEIETLLYKGSEVTVADLASQQIVTVLVCLF